MGFWIATFFGALIATFFLRTFGHWITKRWHGGVVRAFGVNAVSFVIAGLVSAFGFADGGPLRFDLALTVYLPAQCVWLLLDIIRATRKQPLAGVDQSTP